MISKPKVTAVIVFSVLIGLVVTPAFADGYRPRPVGPNPWADQRTGLYPEEVREVEAMETPAAEESLIDSSYNRVAGAAYITGKTITGTANAGGKTVLDTADAGGKALVGTAEAGGRTLGGAADAITGTAGAAYRTVVGGEEPSKELVVEEVQIEEVQIGEVQIEDIEIEEVAIEQPTEKNLFEASWDTLTGTADAIGRTFGAVYTSVFPVKEPKAEPEEPQARRHRFVPRYHGMVARRVAYRGR